MTSFGVLGEVLRNYTIIGNSNRPVEKSGSLATGVSSVVYRRLISLLRHR